MNQTIDVTGDTATGFSRGTWVVTDPEKQLRVSIIANYYDQFVREGRPLEIQASSNRRNGACRIIRLEIGRSLRTRRRDQA